MIRRRVSYVSLGLMILLLFRICGGAQPEEISLVPPYLPRVPTIDQCYEDDVVCDFEANSQFKRDRLVLDIM